MQDILYFTAYLIYFSEATPEILQKKCLNMQF